MAEQAGELLFILWQVILGEPGMQKVALIHF